LLAAGAIQEALGESGGGAGLSSGHQGMDAQHLGFERELRVGEVGRVSVEVADGLRWVLVAESAARARSSCT
jgi:hypothetical protein